MDKRQTAILIEPSPPRAHEIKKVLDQYYTLVYRPKGNELLSREAPAFIDMNSDSIDLIVVTPGRYLEGVLDKHVEYKIPTIVRVNKGTDVDSGIFAKAANGLYMPYVVMGVQQDEGIWLGYITNAEKRAEMLTKKGSGD